MLTAWGEQHWAAEGRCWKERALPVSQACWVPQTGEALEKSLPIPTGNMEGVLLSWFLPSVVFALDSCVLNI